jgi:hypothetical protein
MFASDVEQRREMELAQSRVLLRGQAVTVMQGECRTV